MRTDRENFARASGGPHLAFYPRKADRSQIDLPVRTDAPLERESAIAGSFLDPIIGAASSICTFSTPKDGQGGPDAVVLALELDRICAEVKGGDMTRVEAMLVSQAHILDALFGTLAKRAAMNLGEHLEAGELYLRLAMKAQGQCRATLETLAQIKNPSLIAFVGQANMGQAVQVNNGAQPAAGARAGTSLNSKNELLEHKDAERMESSPARTASGDHQALEALAAGDRPEDRKGKEARGRERAEVRGAHRRGDRGAARDSNAPTGADRRAHPSTSKTTAARAGARA